MLKIEDLINEVVKLSDTYPDAVNQTENGCYYNKGDYGNGIVGCIFGNALRNLGVIVDCDGGDNDIFTPTIDVLLRKLKIVEGNPRKLNWCEEVQLNQDKGRTWAEAVYEANEHYPGVAN